MLLSELQESNLFYLSFLCHCRTRADFLIVPSNIFLISFSDPLRTAFDFLSMCSYKDSDHQYLGSSYKDWDSITFVSWMLTRITLKIIYSKLRLVLLFRSNLFHLLLLIYLHNQVYIFVYLKYNSVEFLITIFA